MSCTTYIVFYCKAICYLLCSVQSGVSQHQSATEGALVSSNMSVRSAAADVHNRASSSSDTQMSLRINSGSSLDVATLRDAVLVAAANAAFILLAKQFVTRQP